ncbi:hypothetical protein M0804_006915 [Polistes exclamans]|nr:hypothetical protein M0804_006915 [Polistes exclamans]
MPILSDFSRRFQLLTTDAKPDPPRVPIQDYTNNLQPNNEEEKKRKFSLRQLISKKNCEQSNSATPLQRQKSAPSGVTTPFAAADFPPKKPTNLDNDDNDNDNDLPSTNGFREYKKPNVKTKTKSRTTKSSQSANVVNYNIVNSNGVKIGARTSYICNINNFLTDKSVPTDTNCSKPKSRLMPENVESLTRCEDEITFDDMFIIKTHIGHGWKDVARRLSYSDGQIEQFEENYRHKGVDEIMYQLLLDWKRANTKDAQIGNLIEVLWFCQEYDCAERVANSRTKL